MKPKKRTQVQVPVLCSIGSVKVVVGTTRYLQNVNPLRVAHLNYLSHTFLGRFFHRIAWGRDPIYPVSIYISWQCHTGNVMWPNDFNWVSRLFELCHLPWRPQSHPPTWPRGWTPLVPLPFVEILNVYGHTCCGSISTVSMYLMVHALSFHINSNLSVSKYTTSGNREIRTLLELSSVQSQGLLSESDLLWLNNVFVDRQKAEAITIVYCPW